VTERNPSCYCCAELPKAQHHIRELEEKLRLTEGAFKNTRIAELEAALATAKDNYVLRSDEATMWAEQVRQKTQRNRELEAALNQACLLLSSVGDAHYKYREMGEFMRKYAGSPLSDTTQDREGEHE
jgi:hypothetical protein